MTAFAISTGAVEFWDTKTGGSINATLDTYTISNDSTLTIRTDSNSCLNHSVAFGSLDTVAFTGQGGTLNFDPTYVRVIAYTVGSGTSPAFGAAISQGGVTGVFLGAWSTWQSECVVPGAAIGATGFIKIGNKAGGNFGAGALTGITALCSGADVQGWIEIRGADTGTITVPRIGAVTSTEAWFELGTTTGVRGQILPCPTTATFAGVFPGVWIETAVGSGIYEPWHSAGSQVALATTPTDNRAQFFWQTVTGIRLGNDGTNAVGKLPVTGCRVRIPATILTNCTRNATTGSGPRVLPNATIATRQEFVTTGAGYFDLQGIVSQWFMNFLQAFYVRYKSCAICDTMILSEIASPLDVDNCVVSPTQAQLNFALAATSCFAGGSIQNSTFVRFSLAAASAYVLNLNFITGVTFTKVKALTLTLRANATTGTCIATQILNCNFNSCVVIGGRIVLITSSNCNINNLSYSDSFIATTATLPMYAIELLSGCSNTILTGGKTLDTIVNTHPYSGWVGLTACYNTTIKEIGTYAVPFNCGSANSLGTVIVGSGNNSGIYFKRCYFSNTRFASYGFLNSDTDILIENVNGDYTDTQSMAVLNGIVKNCALTGATAGQISVYGTHWLTTFTSTTEGFTEILCNEPTSSSALQCYVGGGIPQFNSSGSILLTKVGDSMIWEMPYFAIGYTAFTNIAPTITGTNVTFGTRWGNHDIEFQINTGSGYNGTWLNLIAINLIAQTITETVGYKLKIRATCSIAAVGNIITNMRVAMTTTSVAQSTNMYPLSTNTVSFTGLPSLCDIVVLTSGTNTILSSVDALSGTSYTYTYSGSQTVDVGFLKQGYIPFYIRGLSLSTSNSTLPVSLTLDRNYV